jgi:hypothetical protein
MRKSVLLFALLCSLFVVGCQSDGGTSDADEAKLKDKLKGPVGNPKASHPGGAGAKAGEKRAAGGAPAVGQ